MHIKLNKDQTFQLTEASNEETQALINLAIKYIVKHIVIFDMRQMDKVKELMAEGGQLDYTTKITTSLESENVGMADEHIEDDEMLVKKTTTKTNYH